MGLLIHRLLCASLIALLACLLLACGRGSGALDAISSDKDFSLQLLPETYGFGGSAREISFSRSESAAGVSIELRASGAQGLKALYAELRYDPEHYSLRDCQFSDEFLPAGQRLELSRLAEPGRLALGCLSLRPQELHSRGLSGDAVLVRLNFAPHAEDALRRVSTPPVDDNSRGSCSYDAGNGILTWPYYNSGDYDQNGVVAVQDLTPIGIHFGDPVPESAPGVSDSGSALDVIDGSRDHTINVQDLTSIGVNFGHRVDHYAIYAAADDSAYPAGNTAASSLSPIQDLPLSAAQGDTTSKRASFGAAIPVEFLGDVFWVRPVDSGGNEGTPSLTSEGGGGGFSINGKITEDTDADGIGDSSLGGVLVTATPGGASNVTLSDGTYHLDNLAAGSYTITPALAGYSFAPVSSSVNVPPAGAADFVGTAGGSGNHPPQLDLTTITPNIGTPGSVVELKANATDPDGDVLVYTWSMISGSGSLQATAATLNYEYNGYLAPAGVEELVSIELAVDDQNGGVVSQPFSFSITNTGVPASWHHYPVHTGADTNTGVRSSLADIGGLPLLYYYNQSSGGGDGVYWAIPFGTFGETWASVGKIGDGGFGGLKAFALGDLSGVAAYDDTASLNQLKFYYRSELGTVTHNSFTIDSTTGCGGNVCGVLGPAGEPMLAYHNELGGATGALRFGYSGDWINAVWGSPIAVEGEPETAGVDVGSECSMALIGGIPAIAYYDKTSGSLRYVRSADLIDPNWNNPGPLVIQQDAGVDTGHWPQLLEVEGRPAVYYVDATDNRLVYERAEDATGTSWGAQNYAIDLNDCSSASSISAMVLPNGHPFVAYSRVSDGRLWGTETTSPDGSNLSGDFINTPLSGDFINPSLALVGGHPAVSYYATDGQDLWFSILY